MHIILFLYREGEPAGFILSLLAAISLVVIYQALVMRRNRTA